MPEPKKPVIKAVCLSEEDYEEHCDNNDGYCVACEAWTSEGHVEPDAHEYPCPACHQNAMYGAEELAIMDALVFTEG